LLSDGLDPAYQDQRGYVWSSQVEFGWACLVRSGAKATQAPGRERRHQ
jgi:hypothetical protein